MIEAGGTAEQVLAREIGLAEIEAAQQRLAGHIEHTPLNRSESLSAAIGGSVYLKLETRQITGSFKVRGASNALLALDPGSRMRGVITASTGNHGRALAYCARQAGVRATICMSSRVPQNKVEAVRALDTDVRLIGNSQDEAFAEVARAVREDALVEIPPFDRAEVIAGQGTIGLEILEGLPQVETVLVPLSGGGLAAGVAAAIKSRRPRARIIGVSMERGAAMQASLAAGKPVIVAELPTLADSLGGGIGLDNRYTFAMCRDLVDDVVLLTEPEIAAGIRYAYEREGEIVEGAGAVGIAALIAGKAGAFSPTVVILSGRNIDPDLHRSIIEGRWTGSDLGNNVGQVA